MGREKMKKILIHSIVYSPDGVSTAYLYNDIANGLKENGFEVTVLTTTPHYNVIEKELRLQPLKKKLLGLYSVSFRNDIKIYHIPLKKYKNTLLRFLSFIYWHLSSLILGLSFKKVDYIISPSPPLSIGLVSIILAKIKKARSIYNIQEIYPDLLINQGVIKNAYLIKLLRLLESFIYKHSSALITIDPIFYSKIKDRVLDKEKIYIIPNFVDTAIYKPINQSIELPKIFGKENDNLKVLYAGNIGHFQNWEPVIYAAKKLSDEKIEFWVIGEGVSKNNLIERIEKEKLSNVRIFPYQNRNLMPLLNNIADIHFICVNPKMEQEGFPSKIYTIMASAKPMVIMSGLNTPLYNFFENLKCAVLISNNNKSEFTASIRHLANDKKLREEMGQIGLKEVKLKYSKEIVVKNYIEVIHSI